MAYRLPRCGDPRPSPRPGALERKDPDFTLTLPYCSPPCCGATVGPLFPVERWMFTPTGFSPFAITLLLFSADSSDSYGFIQRFPVALAGLPNCLLQRVMIHGVYEGPVLEFSIHWSCKCSCGCMNSTAFGSAQCSMCQWGFHETPKKENDAVKA